MSMTPVRAEASPTPMLGHPEFVAAWRAGEIEVAIDSRHAASLIASRMMLPFVAMAIIGTGIGLVLWGWLWSGLAVGAIGIVVPKLIKRSAAGMVLQHVEHDPELYRAAVSCGAVVYRTSTGFTPR